MGVGGKILELKNTAFAFDERELMKLERIIIDRDQTDPLRLLRGAVYYKIDYYPSSEIRCY